jgi:hypothetical protein
MKVAAGNKETKRVFVNSKPSSVTSVQLQRSPSRPLHISERRLMWWVLISVSVLRKQLKRQTVCFDFCGAVIYSPCTTLCLHIWEFCQYAFWSSVQQMDGVLRAAARGKHSKTTPAAWRLLPNVCSPNCIVLAEEHSEKHRIGPY